MKNKWIVIAFATISVSFGAARAAAQGPAGVGGGASSAKSSNESSHESRSLNPIKWVKKSPKTPTNKLAAADEQDKKLTSNLQAQGLLPANLAVKDACAGIKNLSTCVAGLHVSHNLGLNWNCLKWDLSGVPTGADMSACKGPASDKAWSLQQAIHNLKPDAHAKAEAKNAEKQAHEDLKQAAA